MKKLMIAAAIVCATACVQAGQLAWSNFSGLEAMGVGGSTAGYSGSIYLMDGLTMDQAAFFTAFVEGGANETAFNTLVQGALNSATITSTPEWDEESGNYLLGDMTKPAVGSLSDGEIYFGDYSAKTPYNVYQVVFDTTKNGLYISDSIYYPDGDGDPIPGTGAASVSFYSADSAIEGTVFDVKDGYGVAGWYQTVPEPTSGLLLLLGVAGLALRRRRA